MNVEIGLRPLNSQKKEYINGIFVSVYLVHSRHVCMAARSLLELGINPLPDGLLASPFADSPRFDWT
jgi:hypothetical protein